MRHSTTTPSSISSASLSSEVTSKPENHFPSSEFSPETETAAQSDLLWRGEDAQSPPGFQLVTWLLETLSRAFSLSPPTVKEVFLVLRESGIQLHHAVYPFRSSAGACDRPGADCISGMFNVLQDFTHSSLRHWEPTGVLEEFKLGKHRICLIYGPHAFLGVVFYGRKTPFQKLRFRRFLTEIHLLYANQLENFDGTLAPLAPIQIRLDRELLAFSRERRVRRLRKVILVALTASVFLSLRLNRQTDGIE